MQHMTVLEYLEFKRIGDVMEKVKINYYVRCFDRDLSLRVDAEQVEQANEIMEEAYNLWHEDTEGMCCEEFILEKLKEAGIWFEEENNDSDEWDEEEY